MKIEKSLLSGSTPMLILALLKDGDKYGYEMVAELARRSDDTFELKEGTLYPLLTRLKNQGMLSYRWEESTQGPPRKYYTLTPKGHQALEEMDAAWNEVIDSVEYIKNK